MKPKHTICSFHTPQACNVALNTSTLPRPKLSLTLAVKLPPTYSLHFATSLSLTSLAMPWRQTFSTPLYSSSRLKSMAPCAKMVSKALSIFCHVWSRKTLGSTFRVGLKFLTSSRFGPPVACMFGAALGMPLRCPFGFAGLLSGLEVMSTTSEWLAMSPRLLGKWYMSAVLMLLTGGASVAASAIAVGELSRRVRFLVGDSGAVAAALGFDWVVKSSLIVLPECFRFNAP
jgi:hypothetical protein